MSCVRFSTNGRKAAATSRHDADIEGENIQVDYRSADGFSERFPMLANELVSLKPDVVVAGGLRPPVTSWGVLLNEAQNINVVALYPWLMLSVVPVFIVVLAFFFGDGLRDAADPYSAAQR